MDLAWLDRAALQGHGVVSLEECLTQGLTRTDVSRLVREGLLVRMLPRVYRTAGAAPTFQQSVWAAHKWAGDSAVFSHRTALKLRRWPAPPGRHVDMSTMMKRRAPAKWLDLHFTRRDPFGETISIGGLPVTRPGRSLLDAASSMNSIRLDMALDHALRVGQVTVTDLLTTLIEAGGRAARAPAG